MRTRYLLERPAYDGPFVSAYDAYDDGNYRGHQQKPANSHARPKGARSKIPSCGKPK